MLEPSSLRKILVTNGMQCGIVPDETQMAHITTMCCCNVIGTNMPLFIIINSLVNLPQDLKDFAENRQAFFSSSTSGWMTRDTSLFFIICFINFLSIYKIQSDDSHKYRECPLALKLLKENNIIYFILPVHTSHLMQFFDVSIGSPFKSCFTTFFMKFLEEFDSSKNNVGQLRYYCVKAALIV